MPTNTQRIAALAATAVILVAGGWLASEASYLSSPAGAEEPARPAPAAVTASDSAAAEPAALRTLSVRLTGLRNGKGAVHVALFDDPAAFAAQDFYNAHRVLSAKAVAGEQVFTFEDVAPGEYAISVHHDENANEAFDMAGLYPLEGYGTSRATDAYQELSFDEASFAGDEARVTVFYLGE